MAAACSAQQAKRTAAQHSMYLCRIACQLLSSSLPKGLAIPHSGKLGILVEAPATVTLVLNAVLLMAFATAFYIAVGVCCSFPLSVSLLISSVVWLASLTSGGGGGGSSSGGCGVMPTRPPCRQGGGADWVFLFGWSGVWRCVGTVGDLFGDDAVPGTLQQSEADGILHLKQHQLETYIRTPMGHFLLFAQSCWLLQRSATIWTQEECQQHDKRVCQTCNNQSQCTLTAMLRPWKQHRLYKRIARQLTKSCAETQLRHLHALHLRDFELSGCHHLICQDLPEEHGCGALAQV